MEQYLGEIIPVAFNFAPTGWALCAGQLMPIMQNQALFSLLGTTYGGDGRTTFALPDLRGRAIIHAGQGQNLSAYQLGQVGGTESVTLLVTQIPAHTHTAVLPATTDAGTTPTPGAVSYPAPGADDQGNSFNLFGTPDNVSNMPAALANAGSSNPHENRQPSLVINYIIALTGVFPSRP